MKQVAVYASERLTNALRKEALIYDNLDRALDAMPEVDWQRCAMPEPDAVVSRPGLREVRPQATVIALGRAAHTVLADYRKQTLVAGLDDHELLEEDVARLVWSCVNTSKVIALGTGAWRSIQMLPFADRRFHEIPPLRMAPPCSGEISRDVLVINHEDEDRLARQVAEALVRDGYSVQRTGRSHDEDGELDHGCWAAQAQIHVHVGSHHIRTEEVRLVDTWQSRRYAILVLPRRAAQNSRADALMVDPEVNGLLCDGAAMVLAACADIQSDHVLRKKLLHAGTATVAPLAREWRTIAAELVC